MTPIAWEIHYADRSVVTSADSTWDAAPAAGVQIVIQWFAETYPCWVGEVLETRHYRNALATFDYYWMGDDGLVAAGFAGDAPAGIFPKEGKYLDDALWMEIYNAAYAKNMID